MADARHPGVHQPLVTVQGGTARCTAYVAQHVTGPDAFAPGPGRDGSWLTRQLIELSVASSALTTDAGSGEKSSEGPKLWPWVIA
jgi:hypothetical protein